MSQRRGGKPRLIILASTFPRWLNDTVPSFVWQYAQVMMPRLDSILVIAPHFPGAKTRERLAEGITVRRFRYALPRYENLAYGQFARSRFYLLKTMCYAGAEGWMTFWACVRRRPDVINAHWLIPQGFVAVLIGRMLHIRVVITVHGSDVFMFNGGVFRLVKRLTLRYADAVTVNSSATQLVCRKLWPHKEYPIIPMGIDLQKFRPAAKPKSGQGVYEALFVGRLAPVKGVQYLCQAMSLLRKDRARVHLTIVGDGPERENIESYVSAQHLEKQVTLAGWVQPAEIIKYYHKADVFVGPSIEDASGRKEALGLVLAEASATGLPVIATRIGGTEDIVRDHETGLLVPPADAEALAGALLCLYQHRQEGQAMGKRGSARIRRQFSWDDIARRYFALLVGRETR